mgnify:CR=1 FL=1
MKTFRFLSLALAAMVAATSFTACSDDDNDADKPIDGVEQIKDVHYDVWVSLNGTTGMGSGSTATSIIVRSLNSLADSTMTIDFKNEGADVTSVMDEEVIVKNGYYYQANPLGTNANYSKFKITNTGVQTIAERPFGVNTFKDRRYTHAWLSDSQFVIMAANGNTNDIIWTKIKDNGTSLTIESEGNLDLAAATGIAKFSTSGLLRYRKSDNTLIYVFQNKNATTSFFVAFIDATTMKVKNFVEETRAALPAGTAYGELLQNKLFMDEHENLYIAANTPFANDRAKSTTSQYGRLLRINAGEFKTDDNYLGYNKPSCENETEPSLAYSSKIITCDYLGKNKALLYLQDPVFTGCASSNKEYTGWGGSAQYNCYYAILDLTTDAVTEVSCNGAPLPYNNGTFSQRSFVLNNKAYIGTNPKAGNPVVYIYNISTGKVTKGASIKEGYDFDRIVYVNGK